MRTNIFFKKTNLPIISFLTTSIMLLLIFILKSFAPFGNNTLASSDAIIQYADFYEYFKDVLNGKNNIFYSFTTGLGQTNIANFSYYLSSPFNLLLIFFDKSNIFSFFNIVAIIKLSLSTTTMSYYLSNRFKKLNSHYIIILSLSYTFMTYNLQAIRNIQYLDGIYMLPLIFYFIYELINNNKHIGLSIVIALSIIFQWYIGLINILFSFFYLIIELSLYKIDNLLTLKNALNKIFLYFYSTFIGFLISQILFLPTFLALRAGRGSSLDINEFNFSFSNLNIIKSLLNYSLGNDIYFNSISLFASSILIIAIIGIFISNIKKQKKILSILLIIFIILLFHWQPIVFSFNLFKRVSSYHFRYAYIGSFILIFISALFFENFNSIFKDNKKIIISTIIYSTSILLLNFIFHCVSVLYLYLTILFLIIYTTLIYLDNKFQNKTINLFKILLIFVCIIELSFNFIEISINRYSTSNIQSYYDYYNDENKQINYIKENDDTNYRISQTSYRFINGNNTFSSYNESMAQNYYGITQYTSGANKKSIELLAKMGYKNENLDTISVVNTSILPVDSLLSVKYILSNRDIKGLTKLDNNMQPLNKNMYINEYQFPFAFKLNGAYQDMKESFLQANYSADKNPFEYINSVYENLFGDNNKVFVPVNFEKTTDENDNTVYIINSKNIKGPIYAYLPTADNDSFVINVNNKYNQDYNSFLSPTVIDIPYKDNEDATLILSKSFKEQNILEYIYYVDLEKLKQLSNIANDNKVNDFNISNGHLSMKINSTGENDLFVSIPNSDGWNAYVNNEPTYIYNVADGLMAIPLMNGDNIVELVYTMPGQISGTILSIIGIFMLIIPIIIKKKKLQIKTKI